MIYDNTHGVFLNDAQVAVFVKAQIWGDETGVTRDDWAFAIQERADAIYADRGLSKEGRFSKAIGGAAHVERGTVYDAGDKLANTSA